VDLDLGTVACNISVAIKFKKTIETISSDVPKAFLKHPWPGNVREIEHTMEHAFVFAAKTSSPSITCRPTS
jgi:transcriptional regulator with PAS, ATPase and Fis domain